MSQQLNTRNILIIVTLSCALVSSRNLKEHESDTKNNTIVNQTDFDLDFVRLLDGATRINAFEAFKRHKNFKLFNSDKCGLTNGDNRIIKGNKTKILTNPWMAALSYYNDNSMAVYCAGTLISERLILTAAHCLRERTPVSIILGDYNLSTDPDCTTDDYNTTTCAEKIQEITDFKILKHDNHREYEDIALIKLNTPANLEHNNINTICLPFEYNDTPIKRFYITGWGRIYNNATYSDTLLGAFVPYVPHEECRKYIGVKLTSGHICAGKEGNSDTCKGDSGGPLTNLLAYDGRVRTYQFGIVSFGPTSGCGTAPGVYTNIYNYLYWIMDNADF